MHGGKQQQMLVRQGPHQAEPVPAPQHHIQGVVSLFHFQSRHVPPAYRPELAAHHNQFSHRPAIGQQAVQITAEETFNAHLSPTAGHHLQEGIQLLLGLGIAAFHLKSAAQPNHLPHRRIQHRQGFPHFPVDPLLSAAQGGEPPHGPEGMDAAPPELAGRRHRGGLVLFSFQSATSFLSFFVPRCRQQSRCAAGPAPWL